MRRQQPLATRWQTTFQTRPPKARSRRFPQTQHPAQQPAANPVKTVPATAEASTVPLPVRKPKK